MRNVRRRIREAPWLPNYRTSERGSMTRMAPSSLAWVKRVMPPLTCARALPLCELTHGAVT